MSESSRIKDLIQWLLKTKKLIRMYPENNPMYIKALDDMYSRFEEAFSISGDITLQIRQYEILYHDEQVYHNPEKTDNLALFLFKDGIRELRFLKGLDKEELKDFLKIISLDEKELVDDDIVTLLWERDFQHIKYVVDESVLTEDEEYEFKATESLMENPTSTDELLRAYRDAMDSKGVEAVEVAPVSEEDLKALMKELEKDSEPKLPKLIYILSEILRTVTSPLATVTSPLATVTSPLATVTSPPTVTSPLGQESDKKDFEEFTSLVKSLLLYSVETGDFESAVRIIKLIKELMNSDMSGDSKTQLKKIIEYAGSQTVIKAMGEVIDRIDIEEDPVKEYIQNLDRNAIEPLIDLLGELKNMTARKLIIDGLASLGRRDMQSLLKGLTDERWYVVRNIVYILRLIGDKRAVEYLLKTIRHPDMRVRREVIKTLGEIKALQAVPILKDYLHDPEPQIRITTVRALGSLHTEGARRLLIQHINTKEFLMRGIEEKKEYFEVLSSWKDQETIELLIKILKRNTLFHRAKNYENRACAAYALGIVGSTLTSLSGEILKLLKKYADSKNPLLREYVKNAIIRIEASYGRN